jgi:hypothetical protein
MTEFSGEFLIKNHEIIFNRHSIEITIKTLTYASIKRGYLLICCLSNFWGNNSLMCNSVMNYLNF